MNNQNSIDKSKTEETIIKLAKAYENKIKDKSNNIDELNRQKKNSLVLSRGFDLAVKYWLAMIGVNLFLFPAIGYFQGSVITGFSVWIISSLAIGGTCLFGNACKKAVNKVSEELSVQIENEEKSKNDYEADLSKLKKHITPVHIECDFEKNVSYVDDKIEDYQVVSGPTLVKKINRRKKK